MTRININPRGFTKTVGAYSHAVKVKLGDKWLICTTGQIAMDAEGNPVAPGDIEKQTRYVFENIKQILEEAGASLDDVIKVQIFVTDVEQFPCISRVRNSYLKDAKPASTLVEISRTVKEGCDVEIEIMAIAE